MKKRIFNVILASVAIIGLWSSCAESVIDNSEEIQNESLKEWISINRPDMVEYDDGLFMRFYPSDPSSDNTTETTYEYSDWFEITYSIQTLDGAYVYNMYSAMSDTLGQFSYKTHFVPDRISANDALYYLCEAQRDALTYMSVLDSVEVIATTDYFSASNANFNSPPLGYGGNAVLSTTSPAHLKLRFNALISDIYATERTEVRTYAKDEMGLDEADSIKGISMMYFEKLVSRSDTDSLSTDTTVTVNYVGMFTDGFVFDTNDEDVAKENNIYSSSSTYDPFSVTISSDTSTDSGVVEGFEEAIKMLRIGEKAKVVFTSNLGYGDEGTVGTDAALSGTQIRPKEPLVFIIELIEED